MRLVHQLLEKTAKEHPDKVALICGQNSYTYRDIDQAANSMALFLIEKGLKAQDRAIIYLENSYESVVSLFGILKAGGIFVLLNPALKKNKLGYIIKDTGAFALVTAKSKINIVQGALESQSALRHVIWCDRNGKNEIETNDIAAIENHNWRPSEYMSPNPPSVQTIDVDLATLIYTSGTSGNPKGVMCAHSNMMAAVQSINGYIQNRPEDIILNVLPLSFDYGLYQILLAFQAGSTLVLEKSFTYPYTLLELLQSRKITGFPLVPTIATILCKMEKKLDLPDLRYITNTGDTLSFDLIEKLATFFPKTRIFSMYGLTECKRVSYLPPSQLLLKPTSVGIPIPDTQAFVVDELGQTLAPDATGELVVRGSHVMQGYWRSPEDTEKTFRPGSTRSDAILYTGDLFKKDAEGYLYFLGRKSDIIKHKGERISPKEIENFLNGIKGVIQSAVVGKPDEIKGQLILAYVVVDKQSGVTIDRLYQKCQEDLEDYLIPHHIEIRENLPVSENGKIDKKQLVQEHTR